MKLSRYLLLAAVVAATAATALADPPSGTRTATFPPVGLASSETAQVNLVNLATNPSNSSNAASCTGSVTFLDPTGAAIGKATTFTVASGQIVSVKLPYSATAASARTEFRASVSLNVGEGAAACSLQSTLETYDTATGVTHVFLSGPQAIVQPFFGRD
ncbi:MAG TPA: hypothetical protein VKX45_11325 [Bryobacteraceae bacterium]|jgi:hypothetical protein|nr:hypothetical protein [Bryobacteraceae bacterium]